MNYHNITKSDMLNGTGLRVVLWVSGCSLHCKNCHNPQTWSPDSGICFDENAKQELFEELGKDYISGITFTGGHPLERCNVYEILRLTKEIREKFPEKTIWVYTGYALEDLIFWNIISEEAYIKDVMEVLHTIDVLVDGRYVDELRDPKLHWVGSSNQRVIDTKATLEKLDMEYIKESFGDQKSPGNSTTYDHDGISRYVANAIVLKESIHYEDEPCSDYKTCGCGE